MAPKRTVKNRYGWFFEIEGHALSGDFVGIFRVLNTDGKAGVAIDLTYEQALQLTEVLSAMALNRRTGKGGRRASDTTRTRKG